MTELSAYLKMVYKTSDEGIFLTQYDDSYWSNLSRDENKLLIESLKNNTAREALVKHQPWLEDIIYSPKRQAGLELLQLTGNEFCIDYGCMWGALSIPLAKRTRFVLGIDQTLDSLRFLKARIEEEKLSNIELLCHDIRKIQILPDDIKADIAIVNGVLEWVPEEGPIELGNYYGKYAPKRYLNHPGYQQEYFLRQVYQNLKGHGKLYLAIENRFDFKMFLGVKDPHANIMFVSILPRKIANYVSLLRLGRPYVNWLYSFDGINALLKKAGFSKVDLYMCFPDYRFPERIIPYENSLDDGYALMISSRNSKGKRTIKRTLARVLQTLAYRLIRENYFAPSIIAIGYK